MQIEFEDTLNDWVEANKIYQKELSWWQWLNEWKLLRLLAILGLIYAWQPLVFERFYDATGVPGTAGYLALIVLVRWFSWRRRISANFSALRKKRGFNATCVAFDPAGVLVHTRDASSTLRWGFFHKWVEGTSVVVLLAGARSMVVLPKRAFSGDQLGQLRSLLDENIGQRQAEQVALNS